MTRIISVGASIVFAMILATITSSLVSAQGATIEKRTFLTFSGAVQVPGATLPAGKYLFRIANPASPSVWEVLDAQERHVLARFFFVRTRDRSIKEQNAANGKPVVQFHEASRGVAPAIDVLYYPTDISGSQFLYHEEQAKQIAAATHRPILATDSDVARGAVPHVITIEPEAAVAQNNPEPAQTAPLIAEERAPQAAGEEPRPVATSGSESERPVGTTGRDQTAAASPSTPIAEPSKPAELPKTASQLPLVGWVGLLALATGVGMRARRRANQS